MEQLNSKQSNTQYTSRCSALLTFTVAPKKVISFGFFFFFLPLTDVAVPHQFGTKIRENIRVL
jgi:hypothetical protein